MHYGYIIPIAFGALVALLLIKINVSALLAARKRTAKDAPRCRVSGEKLASYTGKLQKMIRCRTVYAPGNEAEFARFREVLREEFPLLHERAELTVFGSGCLVFHIKGRDAKRNIMLMSHHDVVDADESEWSRPPFAAEVADGALWGRGAVDTKTPLFAELQAAEELLAEGYGFDGIDLYIGSSDNEEVCGDGMPLAVKHFKEQGIRFDAVLDEGGAVTRGMMPGVKRKSAMVAVHEKGRHTYTCTATNEKKGHLGLNPTSSSAVSRMGEFIAEVQKAGLFKEKFYPEVAEMFRRHAPYMSYPYRLLFTNFGLFKGLLLKVLPRVSGQVKSMLGTTMLFTSVSGESAGEQIQAKEVTATAFFRCVREEDLKKEVAAFKEIAARHGVRVEPSVSDYCAPFSAESGQFRRLERVLRRNCPDAIVSPFLLTAGTDARHFTDIADCILRFAPIDLSPQQFASVYNANDNITLENIGECVLVYKDFIMESSRDSLPEKI